MTCIIGGKHHSGIAVIAADACVSWQAGVTRHEDTLQKLYGLAPNVAVGFCGFLRPAQALLQKCRELMEQKSFDLSPRGDYKTIRHLPLLMKYLVKHRKQLFRFNWNPKEERVGLIIGVACSNGDVRLFHWHSDVQERILEMEASKGDVITTRKAVVEIEAGDAVVYGSIENLVPVYRQYKTEMARLMTVNRQNLELTPVDIGALISSSLAQISSGEPARQEGVGGLFQIVAVGADGEFRGQEYRTSGFDALGSYNVALTWDSDAGRWVQANLVTGEKVLLQNLDERDFSSAPIRYQMFKY